MIVTVWKDDRESNERCITRFNKKVQASRKVLELRGRRFNFRKPTKSYIREAAVKREHYRKLREKNRFY